MISTVTGWKCVGVAPYNASFSVYGDYLVVAAPDQPPYMIHRETGERVEFDPLPPAEMVERHDP